MVTFKRPSKFFLFLQQILFKVSSLNWYKKPQDHWSCIAHMSAEDMLKSAVIEEKKFKILNLSDLDQGQ